MCKRSVCDIIKAHLEEPVRKLTLGLMLVRCRGLHGDASQ